jgi:D-sedoheptulose 7-phosphate isomerase
MAKTQLKLDLIELSKIISLCQSDEFLDKIDTLGRDLIKSIRGGGKLITFGNGGSASESSHLATEILSRCSIDHPPWPAISLPDFSSAMTAIGNDYGFDTVFERQVEAFVKKEDIVIAFSTSGSSKNVILGLQKASMQCSAVYLLTSKNYTHKPENNWKFIQIPSKKTTRIQEIHLLIIHYISENCEMYLNDIE